jgi:hypothetical protein
MIIRSVLDYDSFRSSILEFLWHTKIVECFRVTDTDHISMFLLTSNSLECIRENICWEHVLDLNRIDCRKWKNP